jgi:hypothetical protein
VSQEHLGKRQYRWKSELQLHSFSRAQILISSKAGCYLTSVQAIPEPRVVPRPENGLDFEGGLKTRVPKTRMRTCLVTPSWRPTPCFWWPAKYARMFLRLWIKSSSQIFVWHSLQAQLARNHLDCEQLWLHRSVSQSSTLQHNDTRRFTE